MLRVAARRARSVMQNPGKSLQALLSLLSRGLGRVLGPHLTLPERALRVLTVAVLAFGLWLRSRGVVLGATLPLWNDEAQWAVFLETEELTTLFIRPIAFMALTKGLVEVFGHAEWVYRLLPWLGGVVTLLAAPALARRLFSSSYARFFLVCALALHPGAIDLARDFKPYSVALAFHLVMLILALDYVASQRTRALSLVLGFGVAGVLFAQDIIFLYPALFLAIGLAALRAKLGHHVRAIALAAVSTVALLLGLYALIWSNMDADGERSYWGQKYDVFYMPDSERAPSHAHWVARKTGDVLAMPGMRREHWESAAPHDTLESPLPVRAQVDRYLWIGLGVLGVVALVRCRKPYAALLLLGPIAVLLAFNLLGRWPYGSFRTNLFLLAYATPLTAFAFELKVLATSFLSPLPGLLLVVLPYFTLNRHFHTFKEAFSTSSYFPDSVQRLLDAHEKDKPRKPRRELLALDVMSCASWTYYTRYHPRFSPRRGEITRAFRMRCGRSTRQMLMRGRAKVEDGDRMWGIATGAKQRAELDWRLPGLRVITLTRQGDQQIVIGVERR